VPPGFWLYGAEDIGGPAAFVFVIPARFPAWRCRRGWSHIGVQGEYWIATNGGLCRFDPRPAAGKHCVAYRFTQGVLASQINRLIERRDGSIWVGTEGVFEAICAGACGYLVKETSRERLLSAIRELREGGAPMSPEIARKVVLMFQKVAPPKARERQLTPREFQILRLLADGHSYKTCADQLSLILDTVRFHIRRIYERLHVHSKSEAVLKAVRSGLIS
jgi:DNA-binding CsgD family transcriptional regulator